MSFNIPGMTEIQEQAIFTVGITLHAVQSAERILGYCLAWVAPDDKEMTFDALLSASSENHTRALGFLACELRKHADLEPDFDIQIAKFTDDRNRFVHRLFAEDDFALETDSGARRAIDFMVALAQTASELQRTINAHITTWAAQSSIPGHRAFAQDSLQRSERLDRAVRQFENLIKPKNEWPKL